MPQSSLAHHGEVPPVASSCVVNLVSTPSVSSTTVSGDSFNRCFAGCTLAVGLTHWVLYKPLTGHMQINREGYQVINFLLHAEKESASWDASHFLTEPMGRISLLPS